jgi:hypothetical protein
MPWGRDCPRSINLETGKINVDKLRMNDSGRATFQQYWIIGYLLGILFTQLWQAGAADRG